VGGNGTEQGSVFGRKNGLNGSSIKLTSKGLLTINFEGTGNVELKVGSSSREFGSSCLFDQGT